MSRRCCVKDFPSTGTSESAFLYMFPKYEAEKKAWLDAIPGGQLLGACTRSYHLFCRGAANLKRAKLPTTQRRPHRDFPALNQASCTLPDPTSANVQLLPPKSPKARLVPKTTLDLPSRRQHRARLGQDHRAPPF